MNIQKILLGAFFFLAFFALSASVEGKEKILHFDSQIKVEESGWLEVTETITIRSERKKIRQGIYREFPTQYNGGQFWNFGVHYEVPFEVVKVLRNGKPEAYHIKKQMNGKRIYMGQKGVFIKAGVHRYTLVYRTSRWLRFGKGEDELYWNVTGGGWAFPMEKVTATVYLPRGIEGDEIKVTGYTGYRGSKDRDFRFRKEESKIHFQMTEKLRPKQNFSISVAFPKGHVKEPTTQEKLLLLFRDNLVLFIGFIGLVILFLYYLIVWIQVGKDPEKGTIVPLFEPPEDLSPGAMRYIFNMGYDQKCFSSTLINMAVKKFFTIGDDGRDYTLILKEEDTSKLSVVEAKIARKFFGRDLDLKGPGAEFEIEQSNHKKLKKAQDVLKDHLAYEYEKKYFFTNSKYLIPGVLITIGAVIGAALSLPIEKMTIFIFMSVWLSMWSLGVFALLTAVVASWKDVLFGRKNKLVSLGGAAFITLFSIPFLIGECVGLYMLSKAATVWFIPALLLLVVLNVVFYQLLKAPTRLGRRIMDKIEGFQMYLKTAEKDRLEASMSLRSPEKTPELFEKYLPYALALDVENEWSEKFSDILDQSSRLAESSSYSPTWYTGTSLATVGAAGLASSLGTGLLSSISSSSTAPGSSSGFSGGGGAGGGGGGGGGGGW